MSHHHTYYVTSSYILCHIIIHDVQPCEELETGPDAFKCTVEACVVACVVALAGAVLIAFAVSFSVLFALVTVYVCERQIDSVVVCMCKRERGGGERERER